MRKLTALFLLALCAAPLSAHKLSSPNGKLSIEVKTQSNRPVYSISYAGKAVVASSAVGFDFAEGYFGEGITIGKVSRRTVTDDYDLPVGKTSHVHSVSNEMTFSLVEKSGLKRSVNMVVRAFDDAVAFRYEFPEGNTRLAIKNEVLDINPVGDPTLTALPLPGFINSHEGRYSIGKLTALEEGKIIDMPITFEFPGHIVMSVTEANLKDYAGMYLVRKGKKLTSRLSPRLDRPEFSVLAAKPHITPWRVFFVSDKAGDMIASNVLTTLCDPCEAEDLSWLKPGKTTFPWWNDTCVPDTTFQVGNNFLTAKYYIDFAADSGLDYHSIYGYGDMPWYYDDGPSFG
ncbi:MAG: glycoside hydrolase family 97 N-terminal domain-containing protein, partial [Bacteroidales bacterium]|nr:glycoside hydrolase family 97 N-terminal domain-containing protein [Bacteroidales bacterium]